MHSRIDSQIETKMSNEFFKFKQFTVYHDRCAMKVGTDGVLLGAWAPGGRRILDIGTGTGLIALMMAQRFSGSEIDAVEIDADAVSQAEENVRAAGFDNKINIFHAPLHDFTCLHNDVKCRYDCIVSNPPFYTEDTECPESRRHAARHTDSLSYRELFGCAAQLLADKGTFTIIIPMEAKEKIIFEACLAKMFVKNVCLIKTTPRKPFKRVMMSFTNVHPEESLTEEHCLMNADGSRSEWYEGVTGDFYL